MSGLQGKDSEQTIKAELKKLAAEYSARVIAMDTVGMQSIHESIIELQSKLSASSPSSPNTQKVKPKVRRSPAQLLVETLEAHAAFLTIDHSGSSTPPKGNSGASLSQEITEDPDRVEVSSVIISISNSKDDQYS